MKRLSMRLMFAVVVATMMFLFSSLSFAETKDDGWKFSIGPNIWLTGIDADVTIKGRDADFSADFSDIIENTDGALMLRMELQKGNFGFFLQPNYLKISADDSVEGVNADIDVKFWLVEFGGFYQVGKWEGEMPTTLDVLVGARYWDLSTEIELSASVPGVERKRDVDRDLIDPFIGLRLGTNFTENLKLCLWGDIGGFDLSDNTPKLSWQAGGKLGYQVSKRVTIFAGYRAIGIDSEKDSDNELDLTFSGPLVGFVTQW